jgi:hypothetical protein
VLGAAPGSTWQIFRPGETQFAPGSALGTVAIERVQGADALVRLGPQGPFDPGSRAVPMMPAPAPQRVPVRLREMTPDDRAKVLRVLSRDIVNLVAQNEPAQFLVESHGSTVRLLTGDGLQVVGQFATDRPTSADELAQLLERARRSAEILSLDNAASRLRLVANVAGRSAVQQRGIALVADTGTPTLHFRKAGEPRTAANSLQLQVRVSSDSYLTIVDVDAEGGINLLFPNDHQPATYYPQGHVGGGEPIVLPDSLESGNRAGFHWDYSPPAGADTLRVFASTDLATANLIRERIRDLQRASRSADPQQWSSQAVTAAIGGLREELARVTSIPGSPAADWAATSVSVQVAE